MNHEQYSDPTADIAVERVMRAWKKEVRKNERKEAERKHILQDDTGRKSRSRKKRWFDKG